MSNPVPLLRQGPYLIAMIQSALTDAELTEMFASLSRRAGERPTRAVIIDVSLLDVLDSFGARMLAMGAEMLQLRGAMMIVAGIQPEVAFAMAQLGLALEGVKTALDLDAALALAARNGTP